MKEYYDKLESNLVEYLKESRVVVNTKDFLFELRSNPKYPQLESIVETLETFKIEYNLYKTTIKDIDIHLNSFFAQLQNPSGFSYLSLIQRKNNDYSIDKINIPVEALESQWKGIILVLEKRKPNYLKKGVFIFLTLLLASLVLYFSQTNFALTIFYIFPIIGLFLSIMALEDVLGLKSSVSKDVCMLIKEADCKSIINSKKWKVFKIVDFSDLSFVFFISQMIFLFFMALTIQGKGFFLIQDVLIKIGSPLILLSLYYQKFVEGKWCGICLGIISLLVLEYVYIHVFGTVNYDIFDFESFILFGAIYSLGFVIWIKYKHTLKENSLIRNRVIHYKHHLNTKEVFTYFLTKGEQYNCKPSFIDFYEKDATLNITLVTDPFCEYCKKFHDTLFKLSDEYKDLKWSTVFNVDVENEPSIDQAIYRNMIHGQEQETSDVFKDTLHSWYSNRDEEVWLNKYNQEYVIEEVDTILNKQREWCLDNMISYTPVLFLNGYILPDIYGVEDLKYVIDALINDSKN